jgi:hypothetical protein
MLIMRFVPGLSVREHHKLNIRLGEMRASPTGFFLTWLEHLPGSTVRSFVAGVTQWRLSFECIRLYPN